MTADAVIECRAALALPADRDRAVVLRRVIAVSGAAQVEMMLNPRAEFGSQDARDLDLSNGI